MSINRDNLLGKVRALMAKTVENGCTEEEALSALAKARAMIDAYEIDEAEVIYWGQCPECVQAQPIINKQ